MPTTALAPELDLAAWERALYAFLAEKERRSGSRRTPEGYSRMLQHFFGTVSRPPDRITGREEFGWAGSDSQANARPPSLSAPASPV
jgi:hypothetical protein